MSAAAERSPEGTSEDEFLEERGYHDDATEDPHEPDRMSARAPAVTLSTLRKSSRHQIENPITARTSVIAITTSVGRDEAGVNKNRSSTTHSGRHTARRQRRASSSPIRPSPPRTTRRRMKQ